MLLNVLRGLVRKPPGQSAATQARSWLAQGLEHQRSGRLPEAEQALRLARELDAGSADAAHVLGVLLHRLNRGAEAVAMLECAASLAPGEASVHVNLGSAYLARGMPDKAVASIEHALRVDPRLAAAHSNLGNGYKQLGDLGRAEASYRRALELDPRLAEAWHNLGNLQRERDANTAALASFERALALVPDLLEARYSRALALLGEGDLVRGWEEHEIRFELPRRARDLRAFEHPVWQGESLAGRTLLVWGEQGIGDEILYASMYAELTAQASHCVFECSAKLAPVFARSFPGAQVVARTEPAHAAALVGPTCQIAAGSLGRYLRPDLSSFPARTSFLEADPARVRHWRDRLAALGHGLRIGFSWRSSDATGERSLACSSLAQWRELFAVAGVHWIALQYDDCGEELAAARASMGVALHRFDEVDYFDDLDEVSALTAALDLVISAPNTVSVHAAALGVEVWQLTYGADWQTHGTAGVPWYPTLRRCARAWDRTWEDVLAPLATNLQARVARQGGPQLNANAGSGQVLADALASMRAGDLVQAEARLRAVIARDALAADAWLLLAMVMERAGRIRDAFESAQAAARARPGFFEARMKAGALAADLGDGSAAIVHLAAARSIDASSVEATLAWADAQVRAGGVDAAIEAYREATALADTHAQAWLNLAALLHGRGDLDAARAAAERAVTLQPDSAKARLTLGCILKDQDELSPAAEQIAMSVESDPESSPAWLALGETLQHLGRVDRAEACYRRALEIDPDSAPAMLDLGSLAFTASRMAEASALFSAVAVRRDPEPAGASRHVARASFNRALARLGSGDLADGWIDYEWRFDPQVRVARRHVLPHRFWEGEPLAGRTVVVWGEQGIGDEILFAGMYPELMAAARHCVFECKAKLVPLFARSFPQATVVARTEPAHPVALTGVDLQAAAGSLGRYLRPDLASFPSRRAFLRADEARVELWRQRLALLGPGLKVGFCWRSANTRGERALACTALAQWQALFAVEGVHWIALQYDDCTEELADARACFGVALHRYGEVDYLDDLDEVSALMGGLDLVVSAPTTVSVHAAALGTEVWQMSYGADWQTHGTRGVPWYPTLKRHERRWNQGWEEITARLATELRQRTAQTP